MTHICAWCDQEIGTVAGRLFGEPADNFGMCRKCLHARLDSLPVPLGKRELKRARRMHKSGQSLIQIGHVLGVSEPSVQLALKAA